MTYAPYKKQGGEAIEQFNARHNPELDVDKLVPRPGWLLIWRPGAPQEMEQRGLIKIPDGYKYKYLPLCAQVLKSGEGCEIQPVKDGKKQYVFWRQGATMDQSPQPVAPHFTDKVPSFYWLKEEDVLGVTCESEVELDYELLSDPDLQAKYHKSSCSTEDTNSGGGLIQ